jgi:uncharacterized membrane protein YeaQ/YmgE (transglycosylase-associated protein family)
MDCGTILFWALFGLVIGLIARIIWPGPTPAGCLGTIVLGLAGSVVGGMVSRIFSGEDRPFQPAGIIMSIVGAILVLWFAGMMTRRGPLD